MLTFLPPGLLGLMVAGLLAAYVSTISTHLNWGTSYLVHDLYRRFLQPDATERHYVMAGRLVTAAADARGRAAHAGARSARGTFNLLLSIGAGTGLLYLLRWFWWRINAWSEIAAMVSSFVLAVGLLVLERSGVTIPSHLSLIVTVAVTTAVWLAATFLTPPTDDATLRRFYTLARPAGPGWTEVRRACGASRRPRTCRPRSSAGWPVACSSTARSSAWACCSWAARRRRPSRVVLLVASGVVMWRSVSRMWAQ